MSCAIWLNNKFSASPTSSFASFENTKVLPFLLSIFFGVLLLLAWQTPSVCTLMQSLLNEVELLPMLLQVKAWRIRFDDFFSVYISCAAIFQSRAFLQPALRWQSHQVSALWWVSASRHLSRSCKDYCFWLNRRSPVFSIRWTSANSEPFRQLSRWIDYSNGMHIAMTPDSGLMS